MRKLYMGLLIAFQILILAHVSYAQNPSFDKDGFIQDLLTKEQFPFPALVTSMIIPELGTPAETLRFKSPLLYIIFLDKSFCDDSRTNTIKAMIAHEVGHIVLDHFDKPDVSRQKMEVAADAFAARYVGAEAMIKALSEVTPGKEKNKLWYKERINALENFTGFTGAQSNQADDGQKAKLGAIKVERAVFEKDMAELKNFSEKLSVVFERLKNDETIPNPEKADALFEMTLFDFALLDIEFKILITGEVLRIVENGKSDVTDPIPQLYLEVLEMSNKTSMQAVEETILYIRDGLAVLKDAKSKLEKKYPSLFSR